MIWEAKSSRNERSGFFGTSLAALYISSITSIDNMFVIPGDVIREEVESDRELRFGVYSIQQAAELVCRTQSFIVRKSNGKLCDIGGFLSLISELTGLRFCVADRPLY